MSKEISVKYYQVHNDTYLEPKIIKKSINEVISIGRATDNDIVSNYSNISRNHGKIFLESGIFSEHLDYEDTSKNGTTIIHWDGNKAESKFVHKTKVKIKPGDWIMILEAGRNGMILKPYI